MINETYCRHGNNIIIANNMKMTSQYKTTRKQYDNTDEHETDMIYNNHDSRNKKTT